MQPCRTPGCQHGAQRGDSGAAEAAAGGGAAAGRQCCSEAGGRGRRRRQPAAVAAAAAAGAGVSGGAGAAAAARPAGAPRHGRRAGSSPGRRAPCPGAACSWGAHPVSGTPACLRDASLSLGRQLVSGTPSMLATTRLCGRILRSCERSKRLHVNAGQSMHRVLSCPVASRV